MSISHRKAFELFHKGMHTRLQIGTGELRADRLQAEALAGLQPDQRAELQTHWAKCPECKQDLALSFRLRREAQQRWPLTVTPRRSASEILGAIQDEQHTSARVARLLTPLRIALMAVLLLGVILAFSWVINALRPLSSGSTLPDSTPQSQGSEDGEALSLYPQEAAAFDNFGSAMAVSGDTLLVGAPGTNLKRAHNGGAAFIFQRQGLDWVETVRLLPDPPQAGSGFGHAVGIDGETAAVGARYEFNPGSGNGSGAVYVYKREHDAWQLQARLAASDGAPFDLFGYAVAVHGDILAVGARAADGLNGERNAGAVYLYQRDGDNWYLQARLSPEDLAAEDHFGQALALDDQYLFASAPGRENPGSPNSGVVYVYPLQGDKWLEEAELIAEVPQAEAQLGSVLSLEGDTLAAMASQEYQQGEMPPAAPMYGGDFGAVHIFELQNGEWEWQNRILPPSEEDDGLQLRGLDLAGQRLAISGFLGGTYRYEKVSGEWVQLPTLNPELYSLTWGNVIQMSEDQILLGHRFYDLNSEPYSTGDGISSAGVVFVLDWE
ncbi:MAG: FG-GAP repeat protein [Anaerolineales bacterium]